MRMLTSRISISLVSVCAAIASGCAKDIPTAADLSVAAARASGGGGTNTASGPVVSSVSPGYAKRNTTLDVTITGSGFDRNMSAKWGIDSVVTADVIVNSTRYVSSTQLVANVTVTSNAQLTSYDVIITSTKTGKPGIGTEMFEVVETLPLTSLGGVYNGATSINETGLIAGWSSYSGSAYDRPVLWQNGMIRDLLPSGYFFGHATDINANGKVVGWVIRTSDNYIVPFVWSSSTGMTILPVLPGQNNSGALAINDNGVIAGYSGNYAVTWTNGVISWTHSSANQVATAADVNKAGDVVGYYSATQNGCPCTAFIWRAATGVQLLPTLNGSSGSASAINDNGQIVGSGPLAGDTTSYAFMIENGTARRLSTSPHSYASAVSPTGNAVGGDGTGRAMFWTPSGGAMVICIPPVAASGYRSSCSPGGINSSGAVAGLRTDKYGNTSNAYRWTVTGF